MAKHNKWSKVKHRKAVVDKRRGRVWTKCVRAIMVAAKSGGPDPNFNAPLRMAMDEARYANVPRDTIERAIKKATGEGAEANYEAVRYECYGPGGIAMIVDALTDNRTRTIADVRLLFTKHGGNVGSTGSVAYLFEPKGEIAVSALKGPKDALLPVPEDRLLEIALDAGADDAQAPDPDDPEDAWALTTPVTAFQKVKDALEAAGFVVSQAQLSMVPTTRQLARGEQAKALITLTDALEDLDDIQKVYTNADIPDEELASLS